jgi:NDP-sugar pyrophosphorylase family protein
VGLHSLSDVVGPPELPNHAVIMAGGRGSRLGALTKDVPKPLMEVAGRSILEWIVLTLVGGGIRNVHVAVNHLADQIEDHLGDGERLGCTIDYLRESAANPLGTAGSLATLRAAQPALTDPVLVMNGDLMVQFDPESLLAVHEHSGALVTVATRDYRQEVPFGVVRRGPDGAVSEVEEKPTLAVEANAGVYAVSAAALDMLTPDTFATMPGLIERLLDDGAAVAAWRLPSDWIDIGTPADLARAKGQL